MQNLIIRKADFNDAQELSELAIATAKKELKPYYSKEQWDVFVKYYSTKVLITKIEANDVFCACLGNEIVGTIALDKDFVVGFYTKVNHLGKGIGRLLMEYLEEHARSKGLQKIGLAASPIATGFYTKLGWQTVEECNFEYLGIDFLETLMTKNLETKNPQ